MSKGHPGVLLAKSMNRIYNNSPLQNQLKVLNQFLNHLGSSPYLKNNLERDYDRYEIPW